MSSVSSLIADATLAMNSKPDSWTALARAFLGSEIAVKKSLKGFERSSALSLDFGLGIDISAIPYSNIFAIGLLMSGRKHLPNLYVGRGFQGEVSKRCQENRDDGLDYPTNSRNSLPNISPKRLPAFWPTLKQPQKCGESAAKFSREWESLIVNSMDISSIHISDVSSGQHNR